MEHTAYIKDHFSMSQPLSDYLWELTEGLHAHTRRLYLHIVATTVTRFKKDQTRWIPVAWSLMRERMCKARWKDLVERGLLEATGYTRPTDKERGESRNYRVIESVWNKIVSFYVMPDDEYRRLPRFDLFQNKPLKKKATTKMSDENRNPLCPTWRAAMETMGRVVFNEERLLQGLTWRREQVSRLKSIAERAGATRCEKEAYNRALGRLLNDEHCYGAVQQQQYRDEGNGFASYIPAYECKKTGRATAIGGALQSCTKLMKSWAYSGLESFYNVCNNDLVNSQVLGGIEELKAAGIDDGVEYLRTYRDTPNNKEVYGERAGVSGDCFKRVLLGMLMGGTLPTDMKPRKRKKSKRSKFKYSKYGRGKVHKVIMDEAVATERDPEAVLAGLRIVLSPLDYALYCWHKWIIRQIPARKKSRGRGGAYLENMMGRKLYLHTLKFAEHEVWQTEAQLAAFYLQGRESYFTLNLMALGPQYGFATLSNEHDGLVTDGKIPEEAWRRAGALAGFEGDLWSFAEKAFKATEDA